MSAAEKKVVVFGSCNLDMFFEMPDMNFFVNAGVGAEDMIHFATHKQAPGGKGANQAVAAAKAGAKVHFYGAVGKGSHGRFLLQNFTKLGINTKGIKELDAPTGVAIIYNKPNGKHKATISHAANMLARQKDVPDSVLGKNTIMIFQVETDLKQNELLAARAKKRGATIIYNVDPSVDLTPRLLSCIDYMVFNQPEAEAIAAKIGMNAKNLDSFALAMSKKYKLSCIITLGELGVMAAMSGKDEIRLLPALPVKAVDSIGAGDAFAGAFAAALAKNIAPENALLHGIVAGALACTRIGAQSSLPSASEIKKFLPKLTKLVGQKSTQKK